MSHNSSLNKNIQQEPSETASETTSSSKNSAPAKQNKRIILNTNDDRFALIQWKNNKYNTISMNDVEKFDSYELDQTVRCQFNSNKFPGTVKLIGK